MIRADGTNGPPFAGPPSAVLVPGAIPILAGGIGASVGALGGLSGSFVGGSGQPPLNIQ